MHRINFIHQPLADVDPVRRLHAFLASLLFHALLLGSIVGLSLVYRSHLPPPKSGSAPGAPSITLEKIVVVTPPPPAPQPPKPVTAPPAPAATVMAVVPPREPEKTLPILTAPPSKPTPAIPAKTQTTIHPAILHTAIAITKSPPKPATAAHVSSYAPGLNVLPHPPYPIEARDLRQTGTVIVNVQFDDRGNVAHAEVAQSSGVPVLDSETRSYIREHWHSAEYAGQTISQPVQYSLENF